MKNQFIKNSRGSIIAVVALAFLFVLVQSVVAATAPTNTTVFKGREGWVQQFQIAPKPTSTDPGSLEPSLNGPTQFRVYGDTILSDTIINENAQLRGSYRDDLPDIDPVNIQPTPPATFNVGYETVSGTGMPPSYAQFQVNGGIRVTDLESTTEIGQYCLCADGYGALERCGVFNPSIGETCGA